MNTNAIMEPTSERLAIEGGSPVRTTPLPLEFPGVHHMGDEEIDAATAVLRSRSPFRYYGVELRGEVENFEIEFACFIGVPYALAVSSGSGALQTALSALGVGPGQEVILPSYMWVAVVGAVVNLGAIPVLAEVDASFTLEPQDVERKITPRTSGIIAVHMNGAAADAPALVKIARSRGLFLLEDCAQAVGASIGGKKVGSFGDMAIFSFQMNKNMTSGEGGAVVTGDLRLYRRALASQDNGYARDEKGRLILDDMSLCLWGRGCRMDEMRGAILRAQLAKLPAIVRRMHDSKHRIRQELEKLKGLELRKLMDPDGDSGPFLLTIYPNAKTAAAVCDALRSEGIVTYPQGCSNLLVSNFGMHVYYNIPSLVNRTSVDGRGFPWSLVENAASQTNYAKGACPVSDSLFERSIVLSIPSCLTEQDEQDIIRAFRKVMARYGV